ncbi:MAG: hypothetical protein R2709_00150 [Marmoricola sp.]
MLTCEARTGTCAKCCCCSLATGKLVDIGEAETIIAPSRSVSLARS